MPQRGSNLQYLFLNLTTYTMFEFQCLRSLYCASRCKIPVGALSYPIHRGLANIGPVYTIRATRTWKSAPSEAPPLWSSDYPFETRLCRMYYPFKTENLQPQHATVGA
jgi:hypothetical protein